MQQAEALLNTLKQLLRRAGLTYADAAAALELSEASVKRLFSERAFSLARLETLCDLIGVDFGDLARLSAAQRSQVERLSDAQERELADNPKLLLIGVCVLNRLPFDEMRRRFVLDEPTIIGLLTRLDRLGVITLLPGNRYHLNLARNFTWQPNGPMQRYFMSSVLRDVLGNQSDAKGDRFRFVFGMLSPASAEQMRAKVQRLAQEFTELVEADSRLQSDQRAGAGLLMVLRADWEPADLAAFRSTATQASARAGEPRVSSRKNKNRSMGGAA